MQLTYTLFRTATPTTVMQEAECVLEAYNQAHYNRDSRQMRVHELQFTYLIEPYTVARAVEYVIVVDSFRLSKAFCYYAHILDEDGDS